ncbi:YwaF family protein [Lacinutrix salivirga]
MLASNSLLSKVSIGSLEHLLPIGIALVFAIVFINYSKNKWNASQQVKGFIYLSYFVSLSVVVFHLYSIGKGTYSLSTDLPLYLCSFLALIIPVFAHYRTYWMFEILLFWIIAGTSQGVITPDISEGFPGLDYLRYWIVHLGLLIIIFYAVFVFKMTPKFKSVFKSFLALQVYMLGLFVVNYVLDANYSYLNKKPSSASVLDHLGDWPTYILIVEIFLIPYFLIIYFPFFISEKIKKH